VDPEIICLRNPRCRLRLWLVLLLETISKTSWCNV
jgi:hypothetical protein